MQQGGLAGEVLVLNRLWQAINVVDVRRALTLLFVGRTHVVGDDLAVHTWETWSELSQGAPQDADLVRGPSVQLRVPRVIQMIELERLPRPGVRFTRANVFRRDRHRCQYCGRHARNTRLNLDHVLPRSRGGATSWRNIVVSCVRCNSHKGNRRPEEAGMRLQRDPEQPRWHPGLVLAGRPPLPEWRPFLGHEWHDATD